MANLLWGIPVILCCIGGYIAAWRWMREEKWGFALAAIMLCGLALRIYTATDAGLHDWDERYHALVAKHLAQHWLRPTLYEHPLLPYDFKDWTTSHIWLHKQPFALWLMALSIKVFGLHAYSVRLPAIILTTASIRLCYDIGKEWYGSLVGILVAFLFSIHGFIIELASGRAGTDAIDATFLSMVVCSVWMGLWALRKRSVAAHLLFGIVLGLSILTKWLPALIVLPVWMVMAYQRFSHQPFKFFLCFACILLAAVGVALPWQLYILHAFPEEARWEAAYNVRHFFEAVEGHSEPVFFYFDHLRIKYGELIYIPVIWFTWHTFKRGKAADWAVLIWFWGPYLFFTCSVTKMEAYTVIAAPAIFIITATGFLHFGETARQLRGWKRYLAIALCVGLIVLPIRYAIERIKPFTIMERDSPANRAIQALRCSPRNNERMVIVGCKHPIETMFFTKCTAYELPLDSAIIQRLSKQGYNVITADGY